MKRKSNRKRRENEKGIVELNKEERKRKNYVDRENEKHTNKKTEEEKKAMQR